MKLRNSISFNLIKQKFLFISVDIEILWFISNGGGQYTKKEKEETNGIDKAASIETFVLAALSFFLIDRCSSNNLCTTTQWRHSFFLLFIVFKWLFYRLHCANRATLSGRNNDTTNSKVSFSYS